MSCAIGHTFASSCGGSGELRCNCRHREACPGCADCCGRFLGEAADLLQTIAFATGLDAVILSQARYKVASQIARIVTRDRSRR